MKIIQIKLDKAMYLFVSLNADCQRITPYKIQVPVIKIWVYEKFTCMKCNYKTLQVLLKKVTE